MLNCLKNNLSKLKIENNLENVNQEILFSYIEPLLKSSDKNHKVYSSTSTVLSSNTSSFEIIPKNLKFQKFDSPTCDLSISEIETIINDIPQTPRFEPDEEFKNQNNKNQDLENSIEKNSPIKNVSVFTLSDYVFDEEPLTPKNDKSKLIELPIGEPKIKNCLSKPRKSQTEKVKKVKSKKNIFPEQDFKIKNKEKNYCRNLLEMINDFYKKTLINSEEKIKLKQLVIEKSKKVEYLYYKVYKNLKSDKNTLLTELKKILN